ncbi:head-tail adaptor protein [Actinomadura sp. K4S16]|uniref:head-tail adaptor protein n=1 Tax=Actinomadura sp. K4S16 TaxID=1316147 RepID=UPI0011ED1BFF|nr:head-tail adaptor protein [Actinomadura sp. K4S16]
MRSRATTTVSILRTPPGTVDAYGDPVDTDTPIATRIPASIILRTVRQYLPDEHRTTTVETHTGRLRADIDVQPDDRLKDERTGTIYSIENIARPQSYAGLPDLHLDLKRTT